LTGTPLLNASLTGQKSHDGEATKRQRYNSKLLFGDYIHKYYYNRSIVDGYTLRLIREEIETKYKLQLKETLEQIKVLQDSKSRTLLYSDPKFVEPMLDYIVEDFENSRRTREGLGGKFDQGDPTFVTLKEELERLFKKKNLSKITQAEMVANIKTLKDIAFAKAEMTRLIIEQLKNKHQLPLTAESTQFINSLVMKEYLAEFHGLRASA